jgi:RNA polymerase sigma-70 factor (ECF subfamily)
MDERKLVQQAQAGDYEAFATLVKNYERQLFALARRLTGNEHDAEDVLQDTLLKAIDKIEQFRGDSSFGTWLYAIALNEGRAFLAREKRADLKSLDDLLPAGQHDEIAAGHRVSHWRDPHEVMEDAEIARVIREALDEMRAEYSVPFMLRYHEEMSVKEIARSMGLTEAATKSRILRARLALREKLDKVLRIEDSGEKVRRLH